MRRPFISYAREDLAVAQRLYRDLKRHGADPWFDAAKLQGGQDWPTTIARAIRDSTHVVVLISKNSVAKRGYVQKEVREALTLLNEFPPDAVFVIPVRLDHSEPSHERLKRLHWIDLFPNYSGGLKKLLVTLDLPQRQIAAARSRRMMLRVSARKPVPKVAPRAEGSTDIQQASLNHDVFMRILREIVVAADLMRHDVPVDVIVDAARRAESVPHFFLNIIDELGPVPRVMKWYDISLADSTELYEDLNDLRRAVGLKSFDGSFALLGVDEKRLAKRAKVKRTRS